MAIYNADEVMNRLNEQEVEEYDALDNLVEACDAMMDMLESTAVQRHYGLTQKDMKNAESLRREVLDGSKAGKVLNKVSDAMTSNKRIAERTAGKVANLYHSGKADERIDKGVQGKGIVGKLANKYTDGAFDDMSDREKEQAKIVANASARATSGYALGKYAKNSGADVKGAYNKAAEKADKKKAIKETCLYILSVIDEM